MNIFRFNVPKFINPIKTLCLQLNNSQITVTRHCTVRRAILYIPCKDKRKIEKALTVHVDSLAFDLECNIEEDQELARTNIVELLNSGNVTASDPEWCVRVNPIQKGSVFKSDIDAIFTGKQLPAGIILPEVDSVDLLHWFTEQFWKKLMERPEEDRRPMQLLITIASARGLMMMRDICEKVLDLATMAPLIPSAIIFDNAGFIDSIGGTRTSHGIECLYARQKVVVVAKAFGFQAIDIANTNPLQVAELENECKEGFFLGYTGKQALTPMQVPIIQQLFVPTRSKVSKAKVIIKDFSRRDLNQMADFTPQRIPTEDPQLKIAQNTLKVAALAGKIKED